MIKTVADLRGAPEAFPDAMGVVILMTKAQSETPASPLHSAIFSYRTITMVNELGM